MLSLVSMWLLSAICHIRLLSLKWVMMTVYTQVVGKHCHQDNLTPPTLKDGYSYLFSSITIATFPIVSQQIPDRRNLQEEKVILTHSSQLTIYHCREE